MHVNDFWSFHRIRSGAIDLPIHNMAQLDIRQSLVFCVLLNKTDSSLTQHLIRRHTDKCHPWDERMRSCASTCITIAYSLHGFPICRISTGLLHHITTIDYNFTSSVQIDNYSTEVTMLSLGFPLKLVPMILLPDYGWQNDLASCDCWMMLSASYSGATEVLR